MGFAERLYLGGRMGNVFAQGYNAPADKRFDRQNKPLSLLPAVKPQPAFERLRRTMLD